MLAWHTCVGLRYGPTCRPQAAFRGRDVMRLLDRSAIDLAVRGNLTPRSHSSRRPAWFNLHVGTRNINRVPIGYALGPRLRSRLTLGGLTFPGNLVLAADGLPTRLVVTRSGISTRRRSTGPRGPASRRPTTLSYQSFDSATAARRLVPVIFGAGWLDRSAVTHC